jgi:biopolymer transport protein ExbD
MTAMCDVAFLLLSFFILATKFKPPEALTVITPPSVFTKIAPERNVVMITIDKDGKVYFGVSDMNVPEKEDILRTVSADKNLGLTPAEITSFGKNPSAYIGVPFSQLKQYLALSQDQIKHVAQSGIPVKDSTDNEMIEWIRAAATAFQGTTMHILVKGDNAAKYPSFQGVIIAFKKNDQMKFQMVTNPVAVPPGSELWKANQKSGTKGASS